MITWLRYLTVLACCAARLTAGEVWIRPDGVPGSGDGTLGNPYVRPTASDPLTGLDPLLAGPLVRSNTTIHLMAGSFETEGFALKPGWKLRGAGIDVTILKLKDQVVWSPPNLTIVGGVLGSSTRNDGVEVSDLNIDCNLQNQGPLAPSAVTLYGHDTRISRVKAINWGSTRVPYECFVLWITSGNGSGEILKNCVIEDCIVVQPAPIVHQGGVSPITLGGMPTDPGAFTQTPGPGWLAGTEIRGCFLKDVEIAPPAGAFGKPAYFNGFASGAATIGSKICNNIAINIGGSASYGEVGSTLGHIVENNMFLNVALGIYLNADFNYTHENHFIRDNFITLRNNGVGIAYAGPTHRHIKNLRITGNHIAVHSKAGRASGVAMFSVDNLVFEDNVIDAGGGNEFWVDPASVTISSFKNNWKPSGAPLTQTVAPAVNYGGEEQKVLFTPNPGAIGWYRLMSGPSFAAGRVSISAAYDGKATDLEFHYSVRAYTSNPESVGEINLVRFLDFASGHISMIRVSNNDPGDQVYLDVFLTSATAPAPITLRATGDKNWRLLGPPTFLGNPGPAVVLQKTLFVGAGFRTTGPIFAGAPGQQITDANGKILSAALNLVPPAAGGLGQDFSLLPSGNTVYTVSPGIFGSTPLTEFARSLLASPDRTGALRILGLLPGVEAQPAHLLLANGASWQSVPVSGDALLSTNGLITVTRLSPSQSPIQGYRAATLSSDLVLAHGDARIQHLTASGAHRSVALPRPAPGREFVLHNVGAAFDLIVKEGPTERLRLPPGWFALAVARSSKWELQAFSKQQPFTVSAAGIEATKVGNTPLLVIPNGLGFVTAGVAVETTELVGRLTTAARVQLGNAVQTGSVVSPDTGLSAEARLNTYEVLPIRPNAEVLANGSVLTFRVHTPAVAPRQTLAVHVTGFYRETGSKAMPVRAVWTTNDVE